MKILQNSEIPIYKQISAQLREEIMSGKRGEGEYLPSIRGLARDLKISVITTMKAYEELAAEGLISPIQGKGYIVNPQDREMIREQHLRRLEEYLLNALDAARAAGIGTDEVVEMLRALSGLDE
ncbi:MAG: GntR family transcriptional regulator [Bacteroides sp.]|nr:GntR family transcriptional regulator [Eubacterium sp.]MCM1417766.1 GntR family transcriptional regulator [Roseburia sp.]MCM1461343.1 GntR family transcriptional regulator [Bacteroides sp.]